jgi:preprotein translocase subunit SecA
MISGILKKIFGSRNERLLRQYRSVVLKINALEAGLQGLSDEQLAAKTPELKQRVANGESLDDVLPEAFAVVREAGKRVLGITARSPKCAQVRARRWWRHCRPISMRCPARACMW